MNLCKFKTLYLIPDYGVGISGVLCMRNPYLSLFKTSWQYGCDIRKKLVLVYCLYLGNNIVVALHPLLYAWFIDHLQRKGMEALKYTWMYVGAFFLLRLLEWAFHGPARILERQVAFKISRNFMEETYHIVLHLPVKWHQDHHSGDTINRVKRAYDSLKEFCQGGFVYLNTFCKFFFSFAAMLYFAPLFGLIALILGAFTIWILFKFDKPFVATLKEVNERENTVSASLFDTLSNIMTVITLRLEQRMITNTIMKLKRVFPSFKKNIRINEIKWFTGHMLIGIIFGVTVLGYVSENYRPGQVFYLGGLVAILAYVNNFTSVFNDIAFQYTRIMELDTNMSLVDNVIDYYKKNKKANTVDLLPKNWSKLTINHLNFQHEDVYLRKNVSSVNNVNLILEKGKKIALIGESGSGKSTLLRLIRGLHEAADGVHLTIDDSQSGNFSSLADNVTLFPQDPEIFENTIRYNITLGLQFTEDEIMHACDIAQFSEVARHLPHGLDTSIQEKGVNLSGGQKQRLALARGILAAFSNSLLLLDEPTSSVDPKTEALFYQKFFATFTDRVIISSLHRLHLLPQFDYIYLMQNGVVVGEGSFKDLYNTNSKFMEMWKHQEDALMKEYVKSN